MTPTAPEQAAYITISIPMRPIVRARETIIGHQRKAYVRETPCILTTHAPHPTYMQSHKPVLPRKKSVFVPLRLGTHEYRSEPSR
jgi:hypothetical protein